MRDSKAIPAGTATLTYHNKSYEFPVYAGSEGPDVIDIRKLYGDTDVFTYDPGFTSTASCESDITFIDGDKGILLYRGYSIDQLAAHSNFLEVCYLLLHGELPNKMQMQTFDTSITHHTMVHEQLATFFRGFRRDAHPMAVMCGVVGALSAFYHDSTDINDPRAARDRQPPPDREDADHRGDGVQISRSASPSCIRSIRWAIRRISCACRSRCRPRITRSIRCWRRRWTRSSSCMPITSRTLRPRPCGLPVRLAPIRLRASRPGIACLWGPAHGGANEAALKMLEEIGTVDRIPEFVKRAKDKNDSFRLMGFGHRVYKNYDPRAKAMQVQCHAVLDEARRA